ncbi:glycosyltransferase [Arthrobacter sp. MYb229]|uniref:glycosyltransferase n=1 Tax=Arthrobacter sp. MYb229 TaxID=1848602 RepID=UPI0015E4822E|nr:glycosyltransferase [Arthrobacter sp. MYb229]
MKNTTVVNLHEDLSRDDPGNSPSPYALQTFEGYESGLRKVPDDSSADVVRYYAEDEYVLFVMHEAFSGQVLFADHLRNGKRYKRSFFDSGNLEIKVAWFNQANDLEAEEFFTKSGRRYLLDESPGKYIGRIRAYDSEMNETIFASRGELIHYWLSNFRPDLVENSVLISEYAFMFGGLQKLRITNNCGVIYTLHSSHLSNPHRYGAPVKPELVETLENLKLMDALVVLTPQQRFDLMKSTGAPNVEVIPHAHAKQSEVRRRIPREPGLFVMVSRLSKEKQHEVVIREFARLAADQLEAKLEIWGTGPLEQELRELIIGLKMEDRIKLKGFTKEPLNEYARAEVGLFSSQYEGQSISLMEALSQGCVPVAYDFKYGPRMLIRDMVNGIIVDMNDSADLVSSAFKLIIDRELLSDLSENSIQSVEEFTQEAMAISWIALFNKVKSNKHLGKHDSFR